MNQTGSMVVSMLEKERAARRRGAVAGAVAMALYGAVLPEASAQQAQSLEEIIVTATRREQSVLEVPYNISAVTGESLEASGIRSLVDLKGTLPGLSGSDLGPRANSTNSTFIMRGLNTQDQSGAAVAPNLTVPLVSTYLDEVPLFLNLRFSDVDRVEILRGPQGTLYGSGSVGGTVRVIHRVPSTEALEFDMSARALSTDSSSGASVGLNAVLNLPLSSTVAWRTSAGYEHQQGFIDATNAVVYDRERQPVLADPGDPLGSGMTYRSIEDIDGYSSWFVRSALRWNASESVFAEFAYHHQTDDFDGFSTQTLDAPKYTTQQLIPDQPLHRNADLASLTVSANMGFATLTSATSYTRNRYDDQWDLSRFESFANDNPFLYGGYPRFSSYMTDDYDEQSFNQEFRLVSAASDEWEWVVGAFFRDVTSDLKNPQFVPGFASWSTLPGSADLVNALFGTSYQTLSEYFPDFLFATAPDQTPKRDLTYNFTRSIDFRDMAAYGELTRHITPKWQATVGARFFRSEFEQRVLSQLYTCGVYCSQDGVDTTGAFRGKQSETFTDQIFKFNTSYRLAESAQAYLTVSQGYRIGGANALPLGACPYCYPPDTTLIPYDPDTAVNYEIGLKGFAWDRRLSYSVAAYQIDWDDIQLEVISPVSFITLVLNGKTARSLGIETEISAQLTDTLQMTLAYGYVDAELTEDFVKESFVGRDGDRLPGSPRNQASLAADWYLPMQSFAGLGLHLDAAYRSDVTTAINDLRVRPNGTVVVDPNTNYRVLDGYTIWNASVTLDIDEQWQVRAFGQNLGNELGVSAQLSSPQIPRDRLQYVTRPRTFGVEVSYKIR